MYHYNEEKITAKIDVNVTRFGFLASLSINKSKSTWHIRYILASHYMHAYFPRLNTPSRTSDMNYLFEITTDIVFRITFCNLL
jgi:hypothetical protein